jgi:hypothetical protein
LGLENGTLFSRLSEDGPAMEQLRRVFRNRLMFLWNFVLSRNQELFARVNDVRLNRDIVVQDLGRARRVRQDLSEACKYPK